jgi:hypothetical protein
VFYFSVGMNRWYLRFTLPSWLCQKTSLGERVASKLRGEEVREWK